MSDLAKDLGDACMCGEQFYGRPCLFCEAKQRIAELTEDKTVLEYRLADCHRCSDRLKADNERLRTALQDLRRSSTGQDDGWILDIVEPALKGVSNDG